MIGKFIYRLFLTAFLIGFEIAIYLAVQVAYLRPAGDIYTAACAPGSPCPPFRHAVIALSVIQVAVGATLALGLLSLILAVVMRQKKSSPSVTKKPPTIPTEETKSSAMPDDGLDVDEIE